MVTRSAVIALLSFLTLIDLFGAQALLPMLTEAYGVDPAAMGAAVNASTLGMAVAGLLVAYFSRHIDRKRGISISLALLAIPTCLLGMVDDLTSFTWLRIAQGVFMSTAFTLTMAHLAERCSRSEAATAMAAYITGNVLSNLFGRLLAANLADWLGLSMSFYAFAALNLAGGVLAAFYLSRTMAHEGAGEILPPLKIFRIHLSNPPLIAGFAIGFLILFIFLGIFTYVNFVLAAAPYSLTPVEIGLVYFVFLPAVFTTPMAAWLVKKTDINTAFVISIGVVVLGAAALLGESLPLLLVGLAAIGVGTFCAQAVVSGFIGQAATADRAAASGLYLASYYVGGLVGALVLGAVFTNFGWQATVGLVITASIIAILLSALLKMPEAPST